MSMQNAPPSTLLYRHELKLIELQGLGYEWVTCCQIMDGMGELAESQLKLNVQILREGFRMSMALR